MERQATTRRRTPLPSIRKVKVQQPTITENDLRRRAYEIYLERGPKPGNQIGDWLQAERELKAI
jgi:hypothetical protein